MEDKLRDTYVVVSNTKDNFCMAIYLGNGKARKISSPDENVDWKYIIPYKYFESNDIEKSLKYNLVK